MGARRLRTGGKGRVVMRGILSHTIHFMCYFDSLRYSCFSRKYQGHQIPWRAKQSHNTNTGEMSHLLQRNKREVGASCFFLAVVVLAQSELSRSWLSRHHLEVTSVCRLEQELGGRANSREKHVIVIHYPPLKQHIRHSCSAPRQSQTFHRVLLLLYSIQRSLPR